MNSTILLVTFLVYTAILFLIAYLTSRKADNSSYFTGNRKSNWFVVAYGMIGASLSGVSFMSVPGNVYNERFWYLPMLLGFIGGYLIIALVLLPLYFKMNLTSIYSYLEKRFGICSYKTGASFFIISRFLGATVRTFLVVFVLYNFVLIRPDGSHIMPFWVAAAIFVLIAILYTLKGGVKTIIWTDTFQTTFMIVAVVLSLVFICKELGWGFGDMLSNVHSDPHSDIFDTDWSHGTHWLKRFISGLVVPVAMTGLDQSMIQKSLSCKNLKESQKNMMTSVAMMIPVNLLFLIIGAVLAIFMTNHPELLSSVTKAAGGIEADKIFPTVALSLRPIVGVVFFIGLISAAYPSCANAITSLTTSASIDLIGMEKKDWDDNKKKNVRQRVNILISILFVLMMVAFNYLKSDSVINMVYAIASYTYGPLLGLFMYGILTKKGTSDKAVPFICVLVPVICYCIQNKVFGWGYDFGFALILVIAGLTFLGMLLFSKKNS